MKKERTVDEWWDELEAGEKYRERYGLERSWPELEAMFYQLDKNTSVLGENLVASMGDSLLSTISELEPQVLIESLTQKGVDSARVLERVDNLLIDSLKMMDVGQLCALHAFLWGKGIAKIGYDSEWGWDPGEDLGAGAGFPLGISMSQYNKSGTRRLEFHQRVKPGMPWLEPVLPHDIILPWGVQSIDTSPWIMHRIVRHIDDLKMDTKYNTRGLQPVMSMRDFVKSYTSMGRSFRVTRGSSPPHGTAKRALRGYGTGHADFCELFEIRDLSTGKIQVIATGHDKFLRNDVDILQSGGLPFAELTFVPNARAFWTTPDAYYLKGHQAEISDITLQAAKQRRVAVLKWLFAEGAMDEADIERILSPDVGAAAKVKLGHRLDEAVKLLGTGTPNLGLYQDAEFVRRAARVVVGMSRNQMGEFESQGRRTATETRAVFAGSSARMSRRVRAVGRFYKSIIEKINPVLFDFWSLPRWVAIVGDDGSTDWVEFSGKVLRGDYKYKINLVRGQEESAETRRQEALYLYSILSRDPSVDQLRLREVLTSAFNDPELDGLFGGFSGQGGQGANLPAGMPGLQAGGGGSQGGQGQAQGA